MSTLNVTIDEQTYSVKLDTAAPAGERRTVTVDGQVLEVILPRPAPNIADIQWIVIDGRPYEIVPDPSLRWINLYDGLHTIEVQDTGRQLPRPRSGDGRVKAPIPGLITRVLVEPGAAVTAGQPLVILEAMKMENEIRAPFDGTVHAISAAPGQTVVRNQVLVEVR